MKKSLIISLLLTALITLTGCQSSGSREETMAAAEIDQQVDVALQKLYNSTPSARMLAGRAKGILVFPGVVKAGFIGGVQYGKGALREKGRTVGYYNIAAGSYGLQAGAQTFDYALFFMTKEALDYLKASSGWEVGVGPSVVVVDAGVAKSLTTTTARDDVYAFIFDQRGLMAGLGIQGSKITRVNP
jgi:lipid-binding SYLF domain-containing protein